MLTVFGAYSMSDLFDTSDKGQLALNVLLVAAYLGLNSILNLTNKWALGVYGAEYKMSKCALGMTQ